MFTCRIKTISHRNMNFVSKLKLILVAVFILAYNQYAQTDFDAQYDYAKSLYEQEQYFDAITELKRLFFFDESEKYIYDGNMFIGECYKQGGKFSDAIHYVTIAQINAASEKEIYDASIEIIRLNILRRTTSQALKLIDSLESNPEFESKKSELNYWRGWAYIFSDDWENAAIEFSLIDANHELKMFAEKVDEEQYSVAFAKTISYFIPGAGQFYTGEYLSGLISLGWNVLWGYLTIEAFINDRVFDGIIIGSLLWMRFYRGNFQNAEEFALQKNLEISNKALNYLQYHYKGLKP